MDIILYVIVGVVVVSCTLIALIEYRIRQPVVRVGGWNSEVVARAANEAQVLLQGLVKEYTERSEIHALSSTGILNYLNERSDLFKDKFGVELTSIAIQSLEPTDPEIADALRQQEQARLLEQTEHLNHQARGAAAQAKYQAEGARGG